MNIKKKKIIFLKLYSFIKVKKEIKSVVTKAVLSPEIKERINNKNKSGNNKKKYFLFNKKYKIIKAKYFEIKLPKINSFPKKLLILCGTSWFNPEIFIPLKY